MTTYRTIRRRNWVCAAALAAGSLLAMLAIGPASAGESRLVVPEQSSGGPFYARLERGIVYEADGWVAIAFYREPACVRGDFNLLDFFDFANIPGIFGCELTIHGFELYLKASESPPKHTKTFGNGAVPVLFVPSTDYENAADDDEVTLDELSALTESRWGWATFFEETLHPAQAGRQTMTETVAKGYLDDGRSFRYQVTEVNSTLRHIHIEIR